MKEWTKNVHIESSIPSRDGQYAMFVGRWQPLQAIILEVKDNEVILDFNHPLAGQDLNFEIELVEVVS